MIYDILTTENDYVDTIESDNIRDAIIVFMNQIPPNHWVYDRHYEIVNPLTLERYHVVMDGITYKLSSL